MLQAGEIFLLSLLVGWGDQPKLSCHVAHKHFCCDMQLRICKRLPWQLPAT